MKSLQEVKKVFLTIFTFVTVILIVCLSEKNVYAAEDDIVYIPDANFKALLNEKLGVDDPTADITKEQLAGIQYLTIDGEDEVDDITGIVYCTNLKSLEFDSFFSSVPDIELDSIDVEQLKQLKNIQYLNLRRVKSEDYSFICEYEKLEYIRIYKSDISELPDMSKCTKLTDVNIEYCENLTDISGLSGLFNIITLNLSYCKNLADISAISGSTNITNLNLSDCISISDISALKGMESLIYLNLESIKITKDNEQEYMETIASLSNIESLSMSFCGITDKHTSMFDSLTKLKKLIIGCNDLYDIDFLLKHKDRLVNVQLYDTEISNDDTEVIGQLTELIYLGISQNSITDYSFISKLPNFCGDSTRFSEWNKTFPSKSYIVTNLYNSLDAETYIIKNDVKDANGNYVSPLESELYTYNEETQEITILTDKLDSYVGYIVGYIYYEFVTNTVSGDEIYIEHRKNIKNVDVQLEDVTTSIGNTATISVGISDCDGIEFQWYKDGNIIENETESNLVIENAQISDSGKYTVVLKDRYSEKSFDIIVTVRSILTANLDIEGLSSDLSHAVGDIVTLKASAIGGTGIYTYAYKIKDDETGEMVTIKDYSIDNSCLYEFASTGKKTFYLYVKDSAGKVAMMYYLPVTVTDKLEGTLELSELNVNNETKYMGAVTYTVKATGGSGTYTYKYVSENMETGEITVFRDNHSSSVYRTRLNAIGKNKLTAYVIDSKGRIATTNSVIVTVYGAPEGTLQIDGISDTLNVYVGDEITYTVKASGGSGVYQYNFFIEVDGVRDYTGRLDANVYNKILSSVGETKIYAYVIDSVGNSAITNVITINVYDKLSITGNLSLSEIELGKKVNIIGNPQGGVETKIYTYKVYNSDTKKWYTLADNVTSPVYEWTTNIYGNLEVYIEVKDSIGTTYMSNAMNMLVYRKSGLYKAADSNWYYLVKEEVDTTVTGLVQNSYGWWYVKEGKIDFTYTGLVQNKYGWWYVKSGKVDLTYTGLAQNKYGWWYVKNGKVDFTYTGMATNKYGTWYMNKGKLDTSLSGFVCINSEWLYLSKGKLDVSFTGLVKNKYGTWYVNKGKLDTTVTGLLKNGSEWWYVKSGKVDLTYTGLAQNKYGWWYVKNGKVDFTYTGMAKNQYGWWYVKEGKVDFTYIGMAKNQYGWWYMKNGKLDTTYTGISTNEYGMWYMKNGKLDTTYTGTATYNGKAYKVVKGKVVG